MGTSKSSDGAGPGGLIPDHAKPVIPDDDQSAPEDEQDADDNASDGAPEDADTAEPDNKPEPGRLGPTRTAISSFARGGGEESLKRALGHYVNRNFKGAANAVARQSHVTAAIARLNSALQNIGTGNPDDPFAGVDLSDKSPQDLIGILIDAVVDRDGSLDAELEGECFADALADLLDADEDADLTNLSEEARSKLIEGALGLCAAKSFLLDVQKTLDSRTANRVEANALRQEIVDFIRASVSEAFRSHVTGSLSVIVTECRRSLDAILRTTYEVFGEFIR